MDVIPAIDLMKGEVVRLTKGNPQSAKSYRNLGDPVSTARKWQTNGARIIHVIDLDAALGLGNNTDVIKNIVRSVNVSVQVGGGIRDLAKAQGFLDSGISSIIVGSMAFRQHEVVNTLLNQYGEDRIIVALDHLGDTIRINGWTEQTNIRIDEAVPMFSRIGVRRFLMTSVSRDGTLAGPDLETLRIPCLQSVDVIVAGGIRNLEDIAALKSLGVHGVIVGKAIYEGQIDLGKALALVKDEVK